jgi:hypothetical protein
MAIGDDFTINYGTQEISHTSGSTVYTANALYSWLAGHLRRAGTA